MTRDRKQNTPHAVVVLPTYNERENISRVLDALLLQAHRFPQAKLSTLVVDDCSPDGTGEIVKQYANRYPSVHYLNGQPKQGLGVAYIRGFEYAINQLGADVVLEMDADLSHKPEDVPRLLSPALNGHDFVIGSRYVADGSIPADWPWLRKANSRWGNRFARYVAGLWHVQDCTSGFRAIKTSLLKKIDLKRLGAKGYSFQMNLLHAAVKKQATVSEVPIQFIDRVQGQSKLRFADVAEFVVNALKLGLRELSGHYLAQSMVMGMFLGGALILITEGVLSLSVGLMLITVLFTSLMTIQGIFTLVWMLFAWAHPTRIEANRSPQIFKKPEFSFTALIPARHEKAVIRDTLRTIAHIEYPENLKEAIVICREDDQETIIAARLEIERLNQPNLKLVTFADYPINKPHALNIGVQQATKEVVAIFDAEDEPHKDIYHIINSLMIREQADVVQSGVQLMNYTAPWFSAFNVLEYFFWFKSALHFFARVGVVPLGGNTVFIKKEWLQKIGTWDETIVTEDADIGIRLSSVGAKVAIVYDEQHTTREETPANTRSFIQQRTRWNLGFLQILLKSQWKNLPTFTQRWLTVYLLLASQLQSLWLVYFPFSLWLMLSSKMPMVLTLFSFVPVYLLAIQFIVYSVGMVEFTRDYRLKFFWWLPFKLLGTFLLFQLLLGLSALRALWRLMQGNVAWEKTQHLNQHRSPLLNFARQ